MLISEILKDFDNVDMPEFRNFLIRMENALGTLQLGGLPSVIKETRTLLNADLAHAADSVALVWGDADDANNDLYVKVGASGAGSWTLTGALHSALEAANAPAMEQIDTALNTVNAAFFDLQSAQYADSPLIGVSSPAAGTAGASATYIIGVAADRSEVFDSIDAYANAGTITPGLYTRSGDSFNRVTALPAITLAAGANHVALAAPVTVPAGHYYGFSQSSNVVHWRSGAVSTANYYSGSAGAASFTDATATTSTPMQIKFNRKYQATTLTRLSAVEAKALALASQKSPFVPPLAGPSYRQAVPRRYGLTAADHPVKIYQNSAEAVFSQALYDKYGDLSVIRVTADAASANDYKPECTIVLTAADLARSGIIPNDENPPLVGVRAVISLANLINQDIRTGLNDAYGQVWVALRYNGDDATAANGLSASYQDVVFLNGTTGNSGSYYTPSPNIFSGVTGRLLPNLTEEKGYAREDIPLPATLGGLAFSKMIIKVFGRNPSIGQARMDVARVVVVPGGKVDDADTYLSATEMKELVPSATGTATRKLTLANADTIGLFGNSYMASAMTPAGKGWPSAVSGFSDYNFFNYGKDGETFVSNLARLRANDATYGSEIGPKNISMAYGLICDATNAPFYGSYANYLDDARALGESVQALGAELIISTEFQINKFGGAYELGLQPVAERLGGLFINITPDAKLFETGRNLEQWDTGHPGVRTKDLVAEPTKQFLKTIPRPKQSLKIFRLRPGVSISAIDDLGYKGNYQRGKLFKEILLGQSALTDATVKNMDKLATGTRVYQVVNSEYSKIQAGVGVSFADYALVDAILDGTARTITSATLLLNDPTVTVYVWDSLTSPYETATKYQWFGVSGEPAVVVGDTYTSNDGGLSGTFTVVGRVGGNLIMSPVGPGSIRGAGTLTRVGGSGPTPISYSASQSGYHPDYYSNLGKPEGHWVAVAGDGTGRFKVSSLTGRLDYDRIKFLITKGGSAFTLSKIEVEYEGAGGKAARPVLTHAARARGTELMTQPLCGTSGELAGWTLVGGVTAGRAAGDTAGLPYGTNGYCAVTNGKSLAQTITVPANMEEAREIEIVVWASRMPPLVDPTTYPTGASITPDSFDYDELIVELIDGTVIGVYRAEVGLFWKRAIFRAAIPPGKSSMTIRVSGASADEIQVARVSVKTVL